MVFVCDDLGELKLVTRCSLTATKTALTVEELWTKVIYSFGGGPNCVKLDDFGISSFHEFLKSIPDVVQLETPTDTNSIVNLVSSELSEHMENLVSTNTPKSSSEKKNKHFCRELLVPYRVQCAFIRIFMELYPKGLSISDFESNILCLPIFKSFSNLVDQLLYDLSHIFKRTEMDMITLQPTLINSLKHIKEKDKYLAMDIFNIDEFSLESSESDYKIAKGIEYPLFNILEESVKRNIVLLFDEHPFGVLEREVCDLYIDKFGSSFTHFRRWGFSRVSQLFTNLPELCCVHFLKEEIEIISITNHICDDNNKPNIIEKANEHEYCSKNDGTDDLPTECDVVLYNFLKHDNILLASLDDCYLDRQFQYVELKVNTFLNVNVCHINTDNLPTIMCQIIDESLDFITLLKNMKIFYFLNETKFKFNPDVIKIKHVYAFYLNDSWFRGSVIEYLLNEIKIMNIDDGFIHTIPLEDIRLLHKQFSQLPAQAFTCFLDGILLIDEDVLVQILNKKCTIFIVNVNDHNKTAYIKIKLFNSMSNEYLNDEWIKNGSAEPDDSSDSD